MSTTVDQAATPATASKRGLRAAVLGVLCVIGCLAVPLVAGGAAALFGAVSGAWWVAIASVLLTAGVSAMLVRRRRDAGKGC